MKKLFVIGAVAMSCYFSQTANAQSLLQNLLSGAAQAAAQSGSSSQSGNTGANSQDVLGSILNNVVSNTGNATTDKNKNVGNLIGNLISSVTGNATTTQANLIGDWSYTAPAVQFESENLLTQAGGTALATKCETKLSQYYKVVGIKPGVLKFSFAEDGTCTYAIGAKTLHGTYIFDSKTKTVTITTATGQSVKSYVTISGTNMALCFDGTKLLTLFNTISARYQALSTVSALASNYKGMKVGFKFKK